jgi:hypothetical protein
MEATWTSEMSVDFQWLTQRYIPKDINIYNHRWENLKICVFFYVFLTSSMRITFHTWFDHSYNFRWPVQITKLFIMHFPPSCRYLFSLGYKILFSSLFSYTLIFCSSVVMRRQYTSNSCYMWLCWAAYIPGFVSDFKRIVIFMESII